MWFSKSLLSSHGHFISQRNSNCFWITFQVDREIVSRLWKVQLLPSNFICTLWSVSFSDETNLKLNKLERNRWVNRWIHKNGGCWWFHLSKISSRALIKGLLSQVMDNPQFGSCIVGNRLLGDALLLHQLWVFQSLVCQSCCPHQGTVLCEQRRARCLLKGFDGVWLFPVDLWTDQVLEPCGQGSFAWGGGTSCEALRTAWKKSGYAVVWLFEHIALNLDSIHALWGAVPCKWCDCLCLAG